MQGVCADCWGTKDVRLVPARPARILGLDPFYPLLVLMVLAPLILGALLWILG